MAIKNWKEKEVYMDFSSMYDGNDHPSDIDLFYIGKDREGRDVLIVGEMKYGNTLIKEGQRRLLEAFVDKYNGTAIILYITHHANVYEGETRVDVSRCIVEEYYYRPDGRTGKWVTPRERLTVREVIDTYRGGQRGNGRY